MIYRGKKTSEISFPLGGIGSGCIGLSGNGRLIDWEIFNRPNKYGGNDFSFIAVKAQKDGKTVDARILNSDLNTPYGGTPGELGHSGFGYGPGRVTMAGFPHFETGEFLGEFPIAELSFIDGSFPAKALLRAFNPFIPLNDKDSSIPAAFFEVELTNTTADAMDYTVLMALSNPFKDSGSVNSYSSGGELHTVKLTSALPAGDSPKFGDLSVTTDADDVSYQEYFYRGTWFDKISVFWQEFCKPERLKNRVYTTGSEAERSVDTGCLAAHINMRPGETKTVRFVISWSFPNCENYWNPPKPEDTGDWTSNRWQNYYASQFKDSADSGAYSLKNWNRLYNETALFKNALFDSTLPDEIIDAVSANISILKSPTCLRLEDGSFYAWEGCQGRSGSCEGSCTHVWNYAYALAFLFPKLERSMRSLNYKYNSAEDGSMAFRLQLPLGRPRWGFRPCADGQFGDVIKTYRDWKLSGDGEWLRSIWPEVKKSICYAWSPENKDRWDLDKDGVLEGRQHHTLDMELFGANSWLTGFYLAALKAGAEMAEYLGEPDTAKEFSTLFEKGSRWVDENLWNGEHYVQKLDLSDRSVLEPYADGGSLTGQSTVDAYWNDEINEIKYQFGDGCAIDQVLAQWHANISGLGRIFSAEKTKKALESIHKYNYKSSFRLHFNPCRLYAVNGEAGTVICDWHGLDRPVVSAPYSEEAWSGCEYQAAAHMIQEGLVDEGIKTTKAVRDRYNGENRNPWNEIECGSNYSRSMASYSLLTAYSGFSFNMVEKSLSWKPVRLDGKGGFSCFWSVDSGWGVVRITPKGAELTVHYGSVALRSLSFGKKITSLTLGGKSIPFSPDGETARFDSDIVAEAGQTVTAE